MGRSRAGNGNLKDDKFTGKTGNHHADNTVRSLNEQMNSPESAGDKSAQEAPKQDKPKKRKTVAELTKLLEEAKKRAQQAEEQVQQQQKRIKDLEAEGKQKSEGIQILNDNLRDQTQAYKNRIAELEDSNKVYINGAKSLINRKKEADEKNERLLKTNQGLMDQRSILTETIRQSALKSPKEVDQAREELESASEPKVDNSVKTEGTATPETGEAKVEGEPGVKTEQATQEPNSEAKQTSTESSEMTPEEVYDYLSDKNNFKDAEQYFASGKDAYVGTNDKRIPKSWFDTFKENKDKNHKKLWFNKNNKDVFTASLRDKGLLEDLNKTPDRAETERVKAETAAKAEFDKSIKTMGNKLLGVMGKHPAITTALILTAGVPGAIKFINEFRNSSREQDIEDAKVSDSAFFGDSEDNEDYNGEPIEPGNVAAEVANAAQEAEQADNNAEEQAAQALQENLPQGVTDATNRSKGENPVATNASTPASTKASTAESAPTQGLPPVVTRDAPPANPDSSGMTYSQRVEAGQAPQAGSMAYNANNPDMVTAGLIDAMNQNPQAGSDAIGYGDLYDQNFIDFWAKRNPNLAYAVSQGRKS